MLITHSERAKFEISEQKQSVPSKFKEKGLPESFSVLK